MMDESSTTYEENSRLEAIAVKGASNPEFSTTFVLHAEDHTLGNALRWAINNNDQVTFCGYSVPHPSEDKINIRIQSSTTNSSTILRKGLQDLKDICGHILSVYEEKLNDFNGTNSDFNDDEDLS